VSDRIEPSEQRLSGEGRQIEQAGNEGSQGSADSPDSPDTPDNVDPDQTFKARVLALLGDPTSKEQLAEGTKIYKYEIV